VKIAAYMLFCLGGLICFVNFYLSFLRYPLYKLLNKEYKFVSGFPVFGSMFVVISLIFLWREPWILIPGLTLIAIDTGGLHWFLGTAFYYEVLKKKKTDD